MAKLITGREYGGFRHPSGPEQRENFSPEGVYAALFPWLRSGVAYLEDDFFEDTISSTRWNLAVDDGTTFAWAVARSGTIQGSTGATDDAAIAINGDLQWYGDANAGMECRFKIDVVTGFSFEIGFTDALSDETLPAVTDVDTPATGNAATDVAVVHLDTDQTLTTAAFVSESTGSSFAAQKVNLGTWTPSAATWYTVRVQLMTNAAKCLVFDSNTASRPVLVAGGEKSLTSALEGGTAVRPHMYFRTRNTTAKVVDIDLIRCWQDR